MCVSCIRKLIHTTIDGIPEKQHTQYLVVSVLYYTALHNTCQELFDLSLIRKKRGKETNTFCKKVRIKKAKAEKNRKE